MSSILPSWLSTSYRQYKSDTNSIAWWLAETAASLGCEDASINFDRASQQGKTKSKTKGSKKSGRSNNNNNNNNNKKKKKKKKKKFGKARKHTISSKDLLTISHLIVESAQKSVNTPPAFIATVKRVIKVRKLSNAFVRQPDDSESSEGTRHASFVTILEDILRIFEPLCDGCTDVEQVDEKSRARDNLENMFSSLKFGGTSKEFLQTPIVGTKATESSVGYEFESPSKAEMQPLAVYCLFSDLNEIRTFLKRLWNDNKEGLVDPITATLTTQTAIDLVRRIQEEFVEEFPKQRNFEELIKMYYHIQCTMRDQEPAFKEMADDPFNLTGYEAAEWLFLPAYAQLSNIAGLLRPGKLISSIPDNFGPYDPFSDRAAKPNCEKYQEDRAILLEVLPDFCFMAHTADDILNECELTRGLRGLMVDKDIPLWLIFAAQNFLDIHHIFRQDVGQAF